MEKPGKISNIPGFITALMFFMLTALSLIFFNREPGKESLAENRKLAVFPSFRDENGGILRKKSLKS